VKDIMDSMIDPSADAVWESVGTVIDATGTHETFPQNDEEWAAVRRHAVILMEAANLLLMPGRHIARPGEKAEDPKIELSPEAIEELVKQDRQTWDRLALALHEGAASAIKFIDSKDTEGIMTAGDAIYQACDSCHRKYWYPNDELGLRRF